MPDTWIVVTLVAAVGGAIGFFVVLRGAAFAAHAIPSGSFAGAAGATLAGVSTLLGLGLFAVLGAVGIAGLSHRGRRDVGTALSLVLLLGLGALFLSLSAEPAASIFALLFGEVLGVASAELAPTAGLAAICLVAVATLWRPLLLASALPSSAS
ncbi:MAG TPA: metal ABC transporter permease, partial [Solirubrobacteraceae bacterium]|nr:metal ABC transporter permease [Solirubrobacteraceae bacterium]